MPGMIRKEEWAKKLFYKKMKTPKDKQQNTQNPPSDRLRQQWFIDSQFTQ